MLPPYQNLNVGRGVLDTPKKPPSGREVARSDGRREIHSHHNARKCKSWRSQFMTLVSIHAVGNSLHSNITEKATEILPLLFQLPLEKVGFLAFLNFNHNLPRAKQPSEMGPCAGRCKRKSQGIAPSPFC